MATIDELVRDELLFKYETNSSSRRPDVRLLYVLPQVKEYFDKQLAKQRPHWNDKGLRPIEQFRILFNDFCQGEQMDIGSDFKILQPPTNGIWEFKTDDVRVFGWFVERDVFIAAQIGNANAIKNVVNLIGYQRPINESIKLRVKLPLDEPKYVMGKDAKDVISN